MCAWYVLFVVCVCMVYVVCDMCLYEWCVLCVRVVCVCVHDVFMCMVYGVCVCYVGGVCVFMVCACVSVCMVCVLGGERWDYPQGRTRKSTAVCPPPSSGRSNILSPSPLGSLRTLQKGGLPLLTALAPASSDTGTQEAPINISVD